MLAATGFAELFFHPDVFPSYSPCLHATRRIYNVLRVTQHTAHNTHHVAFSKANDTLCRTHHFTRDTSYITRHIRHTHHFPRITQDSTRLASHSKLHTLHASRITHHSAYHTVCVACHPSHAKHHKSHNTRTMPHKSRHTADVADHPAHASRIKSHGMRHTPQVEDAFDRCSDSSQRFTIKFAVVTRHKHHITPRTSHAYTSRLMHHSELHTSPITRHNADGTSRTLYLSFALIDKRFALATRCSL